MSDKRKLVSVETPEERPGFLGAGHVARAVITRPFPEADPFILLMDDWLDKKDNEPVGGPHPHAGFETVSFLLEGEFGDEEHRMQGGDFEIMTAGSGIVHTETIEKKTRLRLLQLWLALPKAHRWAPPRVQDLPLRHVPRLTENGVDIKLYSGSLAGLKSPIENYSPLIVADIRLGSGITSLQNLPDAYNTFLYVIQGAIKIGDEERLLNQDQVGWLDLPGGDAFSDLKLRAGENGARVILYAGKPTGDKIVSHGPFVGDSLDDIQRLYQDYRYGKMKHISKVPESQRMML